ncbi:polymeric immunoglobulin receptor-like [Mantella aurantiaca]
MKAANPSLLILWSFLIQVASEYLLGPGQVTGSLGGSVTISCYYNSMSANIHGRKFWCKVHRGECYTIVSTTPYVEESYKDRSHLKDFRGHFLINMTSLQAKDAGAYRCGIGNNNNGLVYPVNVTVSQGEKVPSSSEVFIGKLRGSLVIGCPAPDNGSLYWCKVRNTKPAACDVIINTSGQVNSQYWGRVLIQGGRNESGFNVLVNDLRMSDSGFYHCGGDSQAEESDWKDVHLHVIYEWTRKKTFKPLITGQSLQAKCQVPKDFGPEALTYWCRWSPVGCPPLVDSKGFIHKGFKSRIQLTSNNSTDGVYTVIMDHLEVEDSGSYWCVTTDGSKVESSSVNVNVLGKKAVNGWTNDLLVTSLTLYGHVAQALMKGMYLDPPETRWVFLLLTLAPYWNKIVHEGLHNAATTKAYLTSTTIAGGTGTATHAADVSARTGTLPSRSSGTHGAYRSGTVTTLASRHSSEETQRTGNSTFHSQTVTVKNESSADSLVSSRRNLLLIVIPVLVIACLAILSALIAAFIKAQRRRAATDPTADQEQIAMIGGEARPENALHDVTNVFKLESSGDLCGETDV